VCLFQVIHTKLFGVTSQKGSLAQLKVLINCAPNSDPDINMKAFEDFMLITLHSHVVSTAKQICLPHHLIKLKI